MRIFVRTVKILSVIALIAAIGLAWLYYLYVNHLGGLFPGNDRISTEITDEMRAYCEKGGLRIYEYPEGDLGIRGGSGGCDYDGFCSSNLYNTRLQYYQGSAYPSDLKYGPANRVGRERQFYEFRKHPAGDPLCADYYAVAEEKGYETDDRFCLTSTEIDEVNAPYEFGATAVVESGVRFGDGDIGLLFDWRFIKRRSDGIIIAEWRNYYLSNRKSIGYSQEYLCGNLVTPNMVGEVFAHENDRKPLTMPRLEPPKSDELL